MHSTLQGQAPLLLAATGRAVIKFDADGELPTCKRRHPVDSIARRSLEPVTSASGVESIMSASGLSDSIPSQVGKKLPILASLRAGGQPIRLLV
jgi:hypothetical protein